MQTPKPQTRAEQIAAFKAKLEQLHIPHQELQVFGAIFVNVHVKCVGRGSANTWRNALAAAGGDVKAPIPTSWPAAGQKGTNLRPTMRHGYLIAATF